MKSGTLKGLTDHIRILHIGCLLGVFDLDIGLFFLHFSSKTTRPDRGENDEEKSSFLLRLAKNIDLDIFTQKTHDASRKIIKKVGQFYVTLICSSNLRKNRMILVVKSSKTYVTVTAATRVFMYNFQSYSEQRVREL